MRILRWLSFIAIVVILTLIFAFTETWQEILSDQKFSNKLNLLIRGFSILNPKFLHQVIVVELIKTFYVLYYI